MNKITSFLKISLSVFIANITWATVCNLDHCKDIEEIDVCLVDSSHYANFFRQAATNQICGYNSKIHIISKKDDIKAVLDNYVKTCKRIKKLTLTGHGDQGISQIGGRFDANELATVFSPYQCLSSYDTKIHINGCSTGKGCRGRVFLYKFATSFLGTNKGTVSAPSSTSSTFLPGIMPIVPQNGITTELSYDPTNNPHDKWDQSGLTHNHGKSLIESCIDDSEETIKKYQNLAKDIHYDQCSKIITPFRKKNAKQIEHNLTIFTSYKNSTSKHVLSILDSLYNAAEITVINNANDEIEKCLSDQKWNNRIDVLRKVLEK